MKHTYEIQNNIGVIKLSGKLMGESDDLKLIDMVDKLVADKIVNIIMDFTAVEWTNSRGVGICLTGRDTCKQNDGDLKIAGAGEKVMKIFDVTNMRQLFEFHDSLDKAIGSY